MSNERIEFIEKPALINNQARLLYVSSSKYEGDWHSQLHSHHFTELFYVTKGCGGFKIGADEFNVQENDLLLSTLTRCILKFLVIEIHWNIL